MEITDAERQAVEAQLKQVLGSGTFKRSRSLRLLLQALIEDGLSGRARSDGDILKALRYPDGAQVSESILRTKKVQLRGLLKAYYQGEGRGEDLILEVPKWDQIARWNSKKTHKLFPPTPFEPQFLTSLERFFREEGDHGLRCVITEEPASWHLLDNRMAPGFGNLLPLCDRLRSHVKRIYSGNAKARPPELDPSYLADELAPNYYRSWKVSRAYACAHLAFHMGGTSTYAESRDRRIERLCAAFFYVRHRFSSEVVAFTLRNDVWPILRSADRIDPVCAYRLCLEFAALCTDLNYIDLAQSWLDLVDRRISRKFRALLAGRQVSRFSHYRRRAQAVIETNPYDRAAIPLLAQADENRNGNLSGLMILKTLNAYRCLKQNSYTASVIAFEELAPLICEYKKSLALENDWLKLSHVDLTPLADLFLIGSVAAARVQPSGWKDFVVQNLTAGTELMDKGKYRMLSTTWGNLLKGTDALDAPTRKLLRLFPRHIRPLPDDGLREDIESILKCLLKIRICTVTLS